MGPPTKVDLSPAGSDLDVVISDPLTSTNNSMKDNLPKLYYHILYWERSVNTQVENTPLELIPVTNTRPMITILL